MKLSRPGLILFFLGIVLIIPNYALVLAPGIWGDISSISGLLGGIFLPLGFVMIAFGVGEPRNKGEKDFMLGSILGVIFPGLGFLYYDKFKTGVILFGLGAMFIYLVIRVSLIFFVPFLIIWFYGYLKTGKLIKEYYKNRAKKS